MNKTTKIVLGSVLIAAAIGLYIYNNNSKKTDSATTPANPCPSGQVPCASSGKCYDPNIKYNADPCGTTQVSTPIKGSGLSETITKGDISSGM